MRSHVGGVQPGDKRNSSREYGGFESFLSNPRSVEFHGVEVFPLLRSLAAFVDVIERVPGPRFLQKGNATAERIPSTSLGDHFENQFDILNLAKRSEGKKMTRSIFLRVTFGNFSTLSP